MPIRPPEYEQAVNALTPKLHGLPGKIIAIDGRDYSGKTTLGRFLAWYFNVSLIETDLFLLQDEGRTYRSQDIRRIIGTRLAKPRPVIVEGVAIRRLLSHISCAPDFLIYVKNAAFPGSDTLTAELSAYESMHNPEGSANLVS